MAGLADPEGSRLRTAWPAGLAAVALVAIVAPGLIAKPAAATFGFTLTQATALLERPDPGAGVIRTVPGGDFVSMLDNEPEPVRDGWAHVAHEPQQSGRWGEGDKGSMPARFLADCG